MKINNNFYCKLWLLKLCMVWLFLLCVRFFLRSSFWRWIWFFLLLIRCQIRFDSYFHHDFISHTQNSSVFFSYLRGFDTAKRFMNWYSAACIDIDTYREAESEWCVDCECGPGWCVVYIFALSLSALSIHAYVYAAYLYMCSKPAEFGYHAYSRRSCVDANELFAMALLLSDGLLLLLFLLNCWCC